MKPRIDPLRYYVLEQFVDEVALGVPPKADPWALLAQLQKRANDLKKSRPTSERYDGHKRKKRKSPAKPGGESP